MYETIESLGHIYAFTRIAEDSGIWMFRFISKEFIEYVASFLISKTPKD